MSIPTSTPTDGLVARLRAAWRAATPAGLWADAALLCELAAAGVDRVADGVSDMAAGLNRMSVRCEQRSRAAMTPAEKEGHR